MQVKNPPLMTLRELFDLARQAKGQVTHLYLHWTAGRYEQFFDDYHLNIDGEGQLHQTCHCFTDVKAHTYQRNSGAIGIALCCALDATWSGEKPDLGSYPPTIKQLQNVAKVVAVLCAALGLEISEQSVMTHAEAAALDGYGPGSGDSETRWDLAWVQDAKGNLCRGGDFLRQLAQYSSKALLLLAPPSEGEEEE